MESMDAFTRQAVEILTSGNCEGPPTSLGQILARSALHT